MRNRMIITGLASVVVIEIYTAVMQRVFQDTNNRVGKGFTILGIYLFVVFYCECTLSSPSDHSGWCYRCVCINQRTNTCTDGMLNSTTWLYGAEVLPIALRSKIMGVAAASHFIVNVASKSPGPLYLMHICLLSPTTIWVHP